MNSCQKITKTSRKKNDVCGYYAALGISPDASDDEVKAAAHQALLSSHPDTGGDTAEFIKVSEAYKTLSSPQKRAAYDAKEPDVLGVTITTTSAKQKFELPENNGSPAWYKEPQDVLSDADIKLVGAWQEMLLRTAYEVGAALEIKAGISKSLAGYQYIDGIAVIGADIVPERWAAVGMILRKLVDEL